MKAVINPVIAEFVGVFMLVFSGCGAIVIDALTGGAVGHVGISLTFGLIIMAMVYAVGHISGAHFNPAVSIAFAATRHFPARQTVIYIAAQLAGAVSAALTLRLLFGNVADLGVTLPGLHTTGLTGLSPYAVIAITEFILTFALMFVIMSVARDARAIGQMAGVVIGGAVALGSLFAGPVSGASMNPARSLGPAVVSGNLEYLSVYLLFTVAGALAGAYACRAICGCDKDGVPHC